MLLAPPLVLSPPGNGTETKERSMPSQGRAIGGAQLPVTRLALLTSVVAMAGVGLAAAPDAVAARGVVIDSSREITRAVEPFREPGGRVRSRRVTTEIRSVTREVSPVDIGAPVESSDSRAPTALRSSPQRCFLHRKIVSKRANRLPGGQLYKWTHEVNWCGRNNRISWFRSNKAYPRSTGIGVWHVKVNVKGNTPGGGYYIRAWAGSEFCEGIPQWACYQRRYPFHQARYYHGGRVVDEITRAG